jgi:hypothetical protein
LFYEHRYALELAALRSDAVHCPGQRLAIGTQFKPHSDSLYPFARPYRFKGAVADTSYDLGVVPNFTVGRAASASGFRDDQCPCERDTIDALSCRVDDDCRRLP